MRVLKSGIEMTSKQMDKVKGGACACGCNSASVGLSSWADDSGTCGCNCHGQYAAEDGFNSASSYL